MLELEPEGFSIQSDNPTRYCPVKRQGYTFETSEARRDVRSFGEIARTNLITSLSLSLFLRCLPTSVFRVINFCGVRNYESAKAVRIDTRSISIDARKRLLAKPVIRHSREASDYPRNWTKYRAGEYGARSSRTTALLTDVLASGARGTGLTPLLPA